MNLPGSLHALILGSKCEECENSAMYRVQGETDSFGAEMHDLCEAHYMAMRTYNAAHPTIGDCKWCTAKNVVLKPMRDYDEGMSGPVYYVCVPCIVKQNQEAMEEAERFSDEEGMFEYPPEEDLDSAVYGGIQ